MPAERRLPYKTKMFAHGNNAELHKFPIGSEERRLKHVVRIEKESWYSPHARMHSSRILNLLHEAFPNEFPVSISPVSVKIIGKGTEITSTRIRRVNPTGKELEILSKRISNMEKAGFLFDYGEGDKGIALIDGKRVPVFFEIFSFDKKKLEEFLQEKKAPQQVKSKISEIIKMYVRDIVEKELTNSNNNTRYSGVIALQNLGDTANVAKLVGRLRKEKSPIVLEGIIQALGILKVRTAIQEIKRIISKSSRQTLREIAINALGNIGEESTADFLAGMIEDRNSGIRRSAFFSLERVLGETEARKLLQKRKSEKKLSRETELFLNTFGVYLE